MQEIEEGTKAFSTFRVLNGDANVMEREQLFRNMAQLFSFVSDRCDDEQVIQYDEVLCQLAELVEVEARAHVAKLLAPLDRAPGTVVVKLANDVIEVAKPLLEFSSVLSDDDLIDIVANQSEDHRVAVASRHAVAERVSDAITEHGDKVSISRLVRNTKAELGQYAIERLVALAAKDGDIADDLRNRPDIDWGSLRNEIDNAANKVLDEIGQASVDPVTAGKINSVVYNRMRNRAGFNSQEWKVAYNQVKALADRKQLDERALIRFARFGYGHHCAAALTVMLRVGPEVLVKWLAMQDYVAITVALRAAGLSPDLFEAVVATMPWRDLPTEADKVNVRARFEALSAEEAAGIFELWRAHAFRKRGAYGDVMGYA
ncbi:hypothetical protein GCM10011321_03810 [Youhaiella tibetensis]|uniref:DUF2336 domain-containing protein n=1 Tax=Paradevosia tibetensis TaxID=1447062 RepID=A0A5B9DQB9_9HYPH|nr:DUF2336 domain-containing protein [Youhaiella tibetensis]AKR56363.1 hypothetical protein XM25_11260 [Devosia sp. H5989]QEE21417.1 DUF2336 domain-containing protein [Youhaiella tibetensis]GGF15230.1 hypothetical protein GCM10011321_03810 [Youhaiella tibetensis]